ncbi:MAG: hypothetical protein R3190_15485, partial [Thermoanaerobaculia bacterium]|nr:hypothetical protein [Thermoanaerobaculia bacterium]
APAPEGRRNRRLALSLTLFAAGLLLGAVAGRWSARPPEVAPVDIRTVTFSGRDTQPDGSPDGRTVAFVSRRGDRPQIWLKQLGTGGEEPFSEGPDYLPRFSPDGVEILFVRDRDEVTSLYRQALVGGQARKVIENALEGDWSPDGRRIAFLRLGTTADVTSSVHVANSDGSEPRELLRSEGVVMSGIVWSPDGSRLAIGQASASAQRRNALLVIDAATGEAEEIQGLVDLPHSTPAWISADRLLYAQTGNFSGSVAGDASIVFEHDLRSDARWPLFRTQNLFSLNRATPPIFHLLGSGRVVFESATTVEQLAEVALAPAGTGERGALTRGNTGDRQPTYSPDGGTVLFSSGRSGNLDLWTLELATGVVRQLTDDSAADWDPAWSPDGRSILWSSSRGGHLEIWMADADGAGARQVSHDGFDAQNPTMTADGEWIVYASGHPEHLGLFKVRPDGSETTRIYGGFAVVPEVSPDGSLVAFLQRQGERGVNFVRFVEVESGELLPFTIVVRIHQRTYTSYNNGRSRWMPDGRSIVWIGQDENGHEGLFIQDFDRERDTSASRRKLAGFHPERVTETFGVSPDGTRVLLSEQEILSSIQVASGLPLP